MKELFFVLDLALNSVLEPWNRIVIEFVGFQQKIFVSLNRLPAKLFNRICLSIPLPKPAKQG